MFHVNFESISKGHVKYLKLLLPSQFIHVKYTLSLCDTEADYADVMWSVMESEPPR